MQNKKMVIGIIIVIAFIGFILVTKAVLPKAKGKKVVPAAQAKKGLVQAPAKKTFSKGKGGLTVKMLNSKKAEIPMKIRAFKTADSKSSVYAASSVGGRMQEVTAGVYDIEIDTVPQKIVKNIKVAEGKETIENLGSVTGSLVIKAINDKKAPASYPIRILYSKTNDMVTAFMTNRSIEIVPGVYDIEIGILPRQYKKDVRVDAGKETAVDFGCITGTIIVNTVDENKQNVRSTVRVLRADTNEIVSSTVSNRPIELGKGVYNIEVLSTPKQAKENVKVNTGEETVIEFEVKAPAAPVKSAAQKQPPAKKNP